MSRAAAAADAMPSSYAEEALMAPMRCRHRRQRYAAASDFHAIRSGGDIPLPGAAPLRLMPLLASPLMLRVRAADVADFAPRFHATARRRRRRFAARLFHHGLPAPPIRRTPLAPDASVCCATRDASAPRSAIRIMVFTRPRCA
jgi:hypothetical protein